MCIFAQITFNFLLNLQLDLCSYFNINKLIVICMIETTVMSVAIYSLQ